MKKRPIVLCIMDGYGISESINGNAVRLANTPNLDDLMAMYPNTTISASGMPVGLPDGQMGNSEVGHLNIGAGRTVYQSLTLINKALNEKTMSSILEAEEAVNKKSDDSTKESMQKELSTLKEEILSGKRQEQSDIDKANNSSNGGTSSGGTEHLDSGTQGTYFAPVQGVTGYFGSTGSTDGCANYVSHDLSGVASGTPIYAGIDGKAEFLQTYSTQVVSGKTVLTSYGNQVRITLDSEHFYPDLVFYNRILKCFVIIDLKIGKVTHKDIGQMQMYVNYYDREIKSNEENKTIGILLSTDKNETVVKYTLPEDNKTIFSSEFRLTIPSDEDFINVIENEKKNLELV